MKCDINLSIKGLDALVINHYRLRENDIIVEIGEKIYVC